jgi:hydroxymethylpyrimidine/phosphomethylpyrimidine kinase
MGNVVPDRFFWALPPAEEGAEGGEGGEGEGPDSDFEDPKADGGAPRRVH